MTIQRYWLSVTGIVFAAIAVLVFLFLIFTANSQEHRRTASAERSSVVVLTSAPPQAAESSSATIRFGWILTVYYTAVESFHHGQPAVVRGCLTSECEGGSDFLGVYPSDFVAAVKDEGTGRITSAPHKGSYLNWSYDIGYWLDSAPRDSNGEALASFFTAAADRGVLPFGTSFVISECGMSDDGNPIERTVCDAVKSAVWVVRDEFTPGFGGPRHIDLYVGEEDRERFTETSPLYTTMRGASLRIR